MKGEQMISFSKKASDDLLQKLRENPKVKYGEKPVGSVKQVNDDGTVTIEITDPEIMAVLLGSLLPSTSIEA